MRYLRKQPASQSARLALALYLLPLLVVIMAISIQSRRVVTWKGKGGSLRRAIEVVKKGGAVGVMGFAATRRPTASNERRRTIVSVSRWKRSLMMMPKM